MFYACEIWSITSKEDCRWRVLENKFVSTITNKKYKQFIDINIGQVIKNSVAKGEFQNSH
jgi:hypothetical protein